MNAKELAGLWWLNCEQLLTWVARGSLPRPAIVDGKARWKESEIDQYETTGYPKFEKLKFEEIEEIAQAICAEFPELGKETL
jgi:hypothetical protein